MKDREIIDLYWERDEAINRFVCALPDYAQRAFAERYIEDLLRLL